MSFVVVLQCKSVIAHEFFKVRVVPCIVPCIIIYVSGIICFCIECRIGILVFYIFQVGDPILMMSSDLSPASFFTVPSPFNGRLCHDGNPISMCI